MADVKPPLKLEDLIAIGIDPQSAADWLLARKDRGAKTLTVRAWGMLEREAAKAGISASDAVTFCAEKGWQGFHAEGYLQEQRRAGGQPQRRPSFAEQDRAERQRRFGLLTGDTPTAPLDFVEDLRPAAEIMGGANVRRIRH